MRNIEKEELKMITINKLTKEIKNIIDKGKYDSWYSFVEECYNSSSTWNYSIVIVNMSVDIMKALHQNYSFYSVKNMIDKQEHSGASFAFTKQIVKDYSKVGRDFYKWYEKIYEG